MPTITAIIDAQSPSESAALQGHKAKTPEISGIISGSAVGLAWIIGLGIYLWKRHQRLKRARAAGLKSHRELLDPPKQPQAFIIPPDPAIIRGEMVPGERIVVEDVLHHKEGVRHAKSEPLHRQRSRKTSADMLPPIEHSASAPSMLAVDAEPSTSADEKDARPETYERTQHGSA